MDNNEAQLNVSISKQANQIRDVLNDWAIQQGGVAVIGEERDEKTILGYNNAVGPRLRVIFVGEDAIGDESVQELLGWNRRYFDIYIERGKILSDPRNSSLTSTTGPSLPFYDLVETARDIVRGIVFPIPMCINPVEYHSIRPAQASGWMMDSYIISISVVTSIGRIQTVPPQLGTGPYVDLQDPLGMQNNQSFS